MLTRNGGRVIYSVDTYTFTPWSCLVQKQSCTIGHLTPPLELFGMKCLAQVHFSSSGCIGRCLLSQSLDGVYVRKALGCWSYRHVIAVGVFVCVSGNGGTGD